MAVTSAFPFRDLVLPVGTESVSSAYSFRLDSGVHWLLAHQSERLLTDVTIHAQSGWSSAKVFRMHIARCIETAIAYLAVYYLDATNRAIRSSSALRCRGLGIEFDRFLGSVLRCKDPAEANKLDESGDVLPSAFSYRMTSRYVLNRVCLNTLLKQRSEQTTPQSCLDLRQTTSPSLGFRPNVTGMGK